MKTVAQFRTQSIIDKLTGGMKFGLYEHGRTCYLADGMKVEYDELWNALRSINSLKTGHNIPLYDLCPDTFLGTFSHKFKYKWLRQLSTYISR